MSYIGTKTGGHVFRSNAFNSVRYTGDGTTTQYNLPETVVDDDAVLIHIDGVKQHAPTAYSTSGTTLTFTGAPPSASSIEIILFGIGEVNVHTPTTNSVGISALKTSDGTVGQVLTTDGSGNLSFSSKSTETLVSMGVTSTAAELNHVGGVTSALQTQIDGKQASGSYETADATILKSADIGSTVLAPNGDGSQLINLPTSGGVIEATASGTLANGDKVILNSDGTVEVVAPSTISQSIPSGSEYVFNSATTYYISCSFDPSNANKFVVAYRDAGNADYGTAVVGTVSGTTITFGTEYVFNSATTYYISCSFDPNTAGKFVVAYRDVGNASYGTAVVGTVSGTTITFGSEYVFNSASSIYISISFDPSNANKFVVAYSDGGNASYGTAVVGTVSGTTITFGSEYVFNSASSTYISCSFDPNTAGKFVVAYQDGGNASYGTAVVGTVSGTTITFGTEYVFNSATTYYISCSFDPNTAGKFVVAYRDVINTGYGTAVVGTVSGTTISYSAEYVFNSGSTNYISCSLDPNTAGKFVVAYQDGGNGTAVVGQLDAIVTNLTATNFIGISDGAYADTASATIQVVGATDDAQSGLTTGSKHYVQTGGTLSTTPDSPSVYAGIALSPTKLLIKG